MSYWYWIGAQVTCSLLIASNWFHPINHIVNIIVKTWAPLSQDHWLIMHSHVLARFDFYHMRSIDVTRYVHLEHLVSVAHRWWRMYISFERVITLTLSQCTLAGPVYTGMPLVDPVYTVIPLEKLSWNSPTLECHWRNLVKSAPHWNAPGETVTFATYTGTPLEGLWQPTHAPTHIVKHAE